MATVNARLNNAAFYDVTRFDLVKDQKVALEFIGYDGVVEWGAIGDPILDIESEANPFGYVAEVTAKKIGESRVFVVEKAEQGFPILKELKIRVVEAISDPAVTLGVNAEPIDKP